MLAPPCAAQCCAGVPSDVEAVQRGWPPLAPSAARRWPVVVQLAISESLVWSVQELVQRLQCCLTAAGDEGQSAVAAADVPVRIRLLTVDSLRTQISFQGDPFSRPRQAPLRHLLLFSSSATGGGLVKLAQLRLVLPLLQPGWFLSFFSMPAGTWRGDCCPASSTWPTSRQLPSACRA